jgi:hypothetical protein
MISSKYDIVLGIGLVFLLLTISFAGEGRFDILAKKFFCSNSNGNFSSSQLLIQCGGYGNLQQIITLLEQITHLDQFKAYFTMWKQSWYLPSQMTQINC